MEPSRNRLMTDHFDVIVGTREVSAPAESRGLTQLPRFRRRVPAIAATRRQLPPPAGSLPPRVGTLPPPAGRLPHVLVPPCRSLRTGADAWRHLFSGGGNVHHVRRASCRRVPASCRRVSAVCRRASADCAHMAAGCRRASAECAHMAAVAGGWRQSARMRRQLPAGGGTVQTWAGCPRGAGGECPGQSAGAGIPLATPARAGQRGMRFFSGP